MVGICSCPFQRAIHTVLNPCTFQLPQTTKRNSTSNFFAMVKITIDSLNEKKLAEDCTSLKDGAKGIDKLKIFLKTKGFYLADMIQFLRNVQLLRSTTVAHRRSRSENAKLNDYFQFGTKDLKAIFEDIIIKMIWMFNTLEHLLI